MENIKIKIISINNNKKNFKSDNFVYKKQSAYLDDIENISSRLPDNYIGWQDPRELQQKLENEIGDKE